MHAFSPGEPIVVRPAQTGPSPGAGVHAGPAAVGAGSLEQLPSSSRAQEHA